MKRAFAAIMGFLASLALIVPLSWWYMIHYARTVGLTEQNVNHFMWSVIGGSACAIIALTTLFYRSVR